ncbi:MAG: hypothetical protein AB1489_04375 [Acidobacteriota bacterium]
MKRLNSSIKEILKIVKTPALASSITTLFVSGLLLWSDLPWSVRLSYNLNRLAVKLEIQLAAWQGNRPQPISIVGQLTSIDAVTILNGCPKHSTQALTRYTALTRTIIAGCGERRLL